ncbi:MAG: hypothetical protein WBO24_07250 [Nitrospirales bacterium]
MSTQNRLDQQIKPVTDYGEGGYCILRTGVQAQKILHQWEGRSQNEYASRDRL